MTDSDGQDAADVLLGEGLVAECPVTVRRRVLWGDCDPAGVVYTPRFADYLALAFSWFDRVVMSGVASAAPGMRAATPIKALSLEFHHVLRPGDVFDMVVEIEDIRQRTFDLAITGRSPAGEPRFAGKLTPIAVSVPEFRSIDLPAGLETALRTYQDRCAERHERRAVSSNGGPGRDHREIK